MCPTLHDTFLQIKSYVRFLNTDKKEQIALAQVHRAMWKEKEKESNKQEKGNFIKNKGKTQK